MSYASAVEPLRAANLLAGRTLYELVHVAARGARATSSVGAMVDATGTLGEDVGARPRPDFGRTDFDLVVVVAGGDPMAFDGADALAWLRRLDRHGVALGGVSGGPAILARAGVMDGRRMTVHWDHLDAVRAAWPCLPLERQLFVVDRDRLTCAGGTAPLDMMHALLVGHHGHAFARRVSDWLVHTDVRAPAGAQRAGPAERHRTRHPVLLRAIDVMEDHVADPLTLGQLARVCGVGVRQLNRLFADKLGCSTIAFYRDLRLATARDLLRRSGLSIGEIAEASGFGDAALFSRRFKARYGIPPSRARVALVADAPGEPWGEAVPPRPLDD